MTSANILLTCVISLSVLSMYNYSEAMRFKELAKDAVKVAEEYKETTANCIQTMKEYEGKSGKL